MAGFIRKTTFEANEVITVDKLHELIDDLGIKEVDNPSLASGLAMPNVFTADATAEGDSSVLDDGTWRFHNGSSLKRQRTEPYVLPFTNNTGVTVAAGDVVGLDPAAIGQVSKCSANQDFYRVAGPVLVGGANGAGITVVLHGVASVKVAWAQDPNLQSGESRPPGTLVYAPHTTVGDGLAAISVDPDNIGNSLPAWDSGLVGAFGRTLTDLGTFQPGDEDYKTATCILWR